ADGRRGAAGRRGLCPVAPAGPGVARRGAGSPAGGADDGSVERLAPAVVHRRRTGGMDPPRRPARRTRRPRRR
ncbi:MAG: hypothetical protein AVDCRST_MAG06-2783, partial [uncultured Nocardioides sp.]